MSEEFEKLRGSDGKSLAACISSHRSASDITRDIQFGKEVGVSGTPSVFMNGVQLHEVANPEQIRSIVHEVMEQKSNSQDVRWRSMGAPAN